MNRILGLPGAAVIVALLVVVPADVKAAPQHANSEDVALSRPATPAFQHGGDLQRVAQNETPAGNPKPPVTAVEICMTLATTAQDNSLPIDFFTRLIWQESSFNSNAVSYAGAKGIAQFMPATAAGRGLADPFDPLPALEAAGKFLRELRARFGNLGLAAAAYNAGPARSTHGSRAVPRCRARPASMCGRSRRSPQKNGLGSPTSRSIASAT